MTPETPPPPHKTLSPPSQLGQSDVLQQNAQDIVVVWSPQPGPQTAFVQCPIYEVFYGGARGGGKCLPLTEPVLTPFGWRELGRIGVGDVVSGVDGSVSKVISVYRPGKAQTYKLTWSDGAITYCDDNHIWLGSFVGYSNKRDFKHKLYTFSQVRERFAKGGKFLIPLTSPVVFTRPRYTKHGDSQPLDPYLLGVLLGDGSLTGSSVRYSTVDEEIDNAMSMFGTVRIDDGPNRRLINCPNIIKSLKALKLWGKRAETKFIPKNYLWSSIESRWALIQGLMDTDGTADSRGQCYFASSSKQLALDVQFIARSLGFKATLYEKPTSHLTSYNLYLRGQNRENLFRLKRKKERAAIPSQSCHSVRRLVRVELDKVVEVGCFQVDNPQGLFLTRDFVVTHNTDAVLGEFAVHAQKYGEHAIGLMVRRELVELKETIARSKQIYTPLGATYQDVEKMWTFPNGARLRFSYLSNDSDAEGFQGHSYCVGVGTKIRMEGGGLKEVEKIFPGEEVLTLEGPKKVISTVKPYQAPCVRVLVRDDDGGVVGEQVHPIWHPVLTSAGLICSCKENSPRNDEKAPLGLCAFCRRHQESLPGIGQDAPAWFSFLGDENSGYKEFPHSLQALPPLEQLKIPVVLHEPSPQLKASLRPSGRRESNESRGAYKSPLLFQDLLQGWKCFLSYLKQQASLFQSKRGHFYPYQPSAPSCALYGSDAALGSQDYYQLHSHSYDAQPPNAQGIFQENIPLLNDAENKPHEMPLGELGTTQEYIPPYQQWSVHPYTGEERCLSESVKFGTMEVVEFLYSQVADLCIEHANHYISDSGLVNKNTRLYVEEIGNFPDPTPINKLRATLRSGHGVPCRFRATGNPGGPGHHWVRSRYIDPSPLGWEIITEEFIDPFTKEVTLRERIFIPATVKDNKFIGSDYVANLQMSGSPDLVRAWLLGDWTVIQGAYFPEFGQKHIIQPFPIPEHWTKFRSFDWGSYRPFAVGWYAVSDGSIPPYPTNAIIKYREWYGCSGPNLGLKMMVPEVARGILQREFERIDYSVADPSIFKQDGGIPIAEAFRNNGVIFRPADNNRQAGAEQMRLRLVGEDDKPLYYIFKTCPHTIRTLPMLQHDEKKPEGVDTDGEDHIYDCDRYGLMSRPIARTLKKIKTFDPNKVITFDEVLRDYDRKNNSLRRRL